MLNLKEMLEEEVSKYLDNCEDYIESKAKDEMGEYIEEYINDRLDDKIETYVKDYMDYIDVETENKITKMIYNKLEDVLEE